MSRYDVIVVGGGSAGSSAAGAATRAGARTLMINDGELGGLCILRGCMPTKTLLATAHAVHEARHLEPFGARLNGRVEVDFEQVMRRKDDLVARFKKAKIESIEAEDYDVLDGRGRFVGRHDDVAVEVGGEILRARAYVIATGSRPTLLPIPGRQGVPVLTSDDVMRLKQLPERILVQGAGAIGLEMAQFFSRMGSRVVLVNRSPLLSHHDAKCGRELHLALDEQPDLEVCTPGLIERLEPTEDGLLATLDCGGRKRSIESDVLLEAVGRQAALDDLGLDEIGVEVADGRLGVDASMRTSHPRVFAAGDATGTYQILHLSNQEGVVAGHNAAVGQTEKTIDYRLKMSVIFTDPTFAQVGSTENEARAQGRDVVVGEARFPQTGRAITMGIRHGLWRLLVDRGSGEILGSSILGPRADELVHEVALMMHYGGRVADIPELPWYHPTLSEVMLDLYRDVRSQS